MNLSKIKIENQGKANELISILVNSTVSEYPPQEQNLPHTSVRQHWDGYQTEDILRLEHPMLKDPDKEIILNEIYKRLRERDDAHYNVCDFDREPFSDLYHITIWKHGDTTTEEYVTDFLNTYSHHVLHDIWGTRGADDDYYDYCPSATDVFFQLCKLFDARDIWDTFLAALIQQEIADDEPDVTPEHATICNDALYRYKL